jgi:hypothetical protein
MNNIISRTSFGIVSIGDVELGTRSLTSGDPPEPKNLYPPTNEMKDYLDDPSFRELRLLEEVEVTPVTSQRHLAVHLGVALGVANVLVRNLAKKGYIRATRAGWKQWVYNLTPSGVGRKANLTLAYVDRVLGHYRRVREILRDDMEGMALDQNSRMAIYGTEEMGELMYLVLCDMRVTRVDFFDIKGGRRFLGTTVRDLGSIQPGEYAKVMIAFSSDIAEKRADLKSNGVDDSKIITFLRASEDVEVT